MSTFGDRVVNRRTILGGAVAGVAGAAMAPGLAAHAGNGRPLDEDAVRAVASRLDGDLIALRRSINRHPEISGQEQRTAEAVAQRLRAAGLHVTTGVGGHGVVGVLTGSRRGRTVAYRADMDAVAGDNGAPAAHLCGHDIHTTVGVGVAQVLARLRDRLSGTVVFVFQPAEETLAGAAAMLADGVFSRAQPAEIHALHCGPFPVGSFGVTPGFGLPGLDRGVITLTGADALVRAQQLATAINALGTVSFPTTTAGREQLIADILTPGGPLARFVFMQARPGGTESLAEVRVFYRCWPEDRYTEIRQNIHQLAASSGASSVSFPNDPFPAMVSPEREGQELKRYLRQRIGRDRVQTMHAAIPFNGEDFALFLDGRPGTFTFLGVRTPGAAVETSFPHSPVFNPDERAIGHGVRAMSGWLASRVSLPPR